MNKKSIIIVLSVLGFLIIVLIIWLVLQNSASSVSTQLTPVISSSTVDLPVVNQAGLNSQSQGVVVKERDKVDEVVIEDSFQWSRILFTNENDASRRLQSYFERTNLDQEIILDKCNLVSDTSCAADFKAVISACKLTGEDWSHLPMAFNRSTKLCYQGYSEIIKYLQSESASVIKNRR